MNSHTTAPAPTTAAPTAVEPSPAHLHAPTKPRPTPPRVLSIAGSDPSGGAGIQADIKSISAHGGYAMAAVTALTAQNTQGVWGVHVPPAAFLTSQLDALAADVEIDAVKIGMLPDPATAAAVGEWLQRTRPAVVVLDPVMVATSGDTLAGGKVLPALLELLRHADLVTPNLPELAVLAGEPEADSWEAALLQGKRLAASHAVTVLVKGGHLADGDCTDALVGPDGAIESFPGTRIDTANTHGTGCSLSAALATLQAGTGSWSESLRRAKHWLTGALATSERLDVGRGHGPVNHFHELWPGSAPGDFSQELWDGCAEDRREIFELDFIKTLADGTLPESHFAYYLAEDAAYLNAYSRVLARASVLAPTEAEQRFWAAGAQNCLEVELSLHRDWLGRHGKAGADGASPAVPGPVTKRYVDHLQAVAFAGSYGEVVAAVLPCYWLYAEVGRVLHEDYLAFEGEHPYAAWLESYADEAFAQACRTAVGIVDDAARRAGSAERGRMRAAFAHSARCEVGFFDAPRLHAVPAGAAHAIE